MTKESAAIFRSTSRMPAGSETFISPTKSFAQNYDGALFRVRLNPGTVSQLEAIGVRNNAVFHPYSDLPLVSKGWKSMNAFFKAEGGQVNIGLGDGKALEIFNDNIKSVKQIIR